MKIPMTAREQLLAARDLGHELGVRTREFPEFPGTPPKFYIECSCGFRGNVVRSRKGANAALIWHMSRVLSEAAAGDSKNGGPRAG